MSVKVTSWVWHSERAEQASGNDLVVLMALADVADDSGSVVFVDDEMGTQEGLARKARVSRRTFQRSVQRLADMGLVEVSRSGRMELNRYRILIDAPVRQDDASMRLSCVTGDASRASQVTHRSSYNVVIHKPENASTPRGVPDEVTEAFDRAWKDWPHKVSKAKSRDAFTRAAKHHDPAWLADEMSKAGKRYANEYPRPDQKRYIPHASTWLNGARWEDELPQQQAQSSDDWMQP